jgi:hypothetical protein
MMSDASQLNYIRFVLFAGATYNQMPKELEAIRRAFKSNQRISTLRKSIEEIKKNFPKFKEGKDFYYFEDFETKTNWRPKQELLSNCSAIAQLQTEKSRVEESRVEESRVEKKPSARPLSDSEFLEALKKNPAYSHIRIDDEMCKMDSWLLTHRGRQKTRRFIVNWLNKIEKPFAGQKPVVKKPEEVSKEKEWEKQARVDPQEVRKLVQGLTQKVGATNVVPQKK